TAAQSIDVQGTFSNSTNAATTINNANGVSLVTNLTLSGPLAFTAGRLNTGARTLTLGSAATVSGAAQGTGWVNGTLKRNFAVGAFTGALDVGDAAKYTPIVVSGTGAGAGFNLTASTTPGDHPNLATSTIDPLHSVNRTWSLVPANAAGAAWSATFNFA